MCTPSKSYLNVHIIHSPFHFHPSFAGLSIRRKPTTTRHQQTNHNAISTTILRPKNALTHLAHLPTTQPPRILHRSVLPLRLRTHHRTSRIRFTLNHICIHIVINTQSPLTLRRILGSTDYHIAAYIIVNTAHVAGYTTTIAAYQIHREAV
jgi:tRNA threonylcarbamoyladenosine modification (KEOPS) complex  Pcc1 subunit